MKTHLIALVLFIIGLVAGTLFLEATRPSQAAPAYVPTVHRERITLNIPGSGDGQSGSATTSAVIAGEVLRVDVNYGASLTTTTDLTLAGTNDGVAGNVVTLSNTATDIRVYPSIALTTIAGVAQTYDGAQSVVVPFPVADQLTLSLAQTTAATPAVVVDIFWKE